MISRTGVDSFAVQFKSTNNVYQVLDVLDQATQRGSMSDDENPLSGSQLRLDSFNPERYSALDKVLEGLVSGEVLLGDISENWTAHCKDKLNDQIVFI